MALEYSLMIENNIDISDVKKLLVKAPDFRLEKGEIIALDLLIYVTKPRELSIQVVEDEFEFLPTIDITFRLDKFADRNVLKQRLMQAIWIILNSAQGDAVVLFNGETIILRRKNEKLFLNKIDKFWNEGTLPTDQPYEFIMMQHI